MIKRLLASVIFVSALSGGYPIAAAQSDPSPIAPSVPFAVTTPAPTSIPPADDGRLTACSAPLRDDFRPYLVRPGDRLALLLIGHTAFTPAQIAALNCLPDADDLPVGAVVWLPRDAFSVSDRSAAAAEPALVLDGTAAANEPEVTPQAEATAPVAATAPGAAAALDLAPQAVILNDQPLTAAWTGTGDHAFVYLCPPAESLSACQRPALTPPLPVTGSLSIGPFAWPGVYVLVAEFVVDASDTPPTRTAQPFLVTCAQISLAGASAPRRCPDEPPRTVFGAYQRFEHGAMIYMADVEQITVLTEADQRFAVYDDVYVEGMPDPDVPAPQGVITPVRGFGQVWRTLGAEAAALGFGVVVEQGYDAQRQPAARGSYTTYVSTPDGVVALTTIPGQPGGWWAWVGSTRPASP